MKKTFLLLIPILIMLIGCAPAAAGNTPISDTTQQVAPNIAAVNANATVQALNVQSTAAQMQVDLLNQQSTSTSAAATAIAFAPFATGTQAAAELQVAQMYSNATSTSAAATQTAAMMQQAYNAQATTTAGVVTQIAAVTQQAFMVQQDIDANAAQRREFSNWLWAILPPVLLISAVVYIFITASRLLRNKPVARDEFGKTQPIIDIVTGDYLDLSASPNYAHINKSVFEQIVLQWLEKKYGYIPNMPRITAERQDITKEREQVIEVERIRRARMPKALIDAQSLQFLPEPAEENDLIQEAEIYPELPLPNWAQLNKWDGHLLPVGNDENSNLMLVDTSLRPHLLYAGRSRSGKTLTGERTAVACLLTQGWNVIVMGKRVDWMPFTDHPNFKLLAVDVRKDAQKYIDILQILSAQMDIRDSLLTSKGIGTWERYGAPSTMVVLDDYSGALIRMPKPKANEVIAEVRSIALDGAKFGISITIGLQDATAQNIDTTTRSQMARIVYSMDNATKSRIALGSNSGEGAGAECLPPFRHFLARVSDDANIRRGVGFFLQDREVEAFLASRPVQQNGQLEWVDGVIVEQPSFPMHEPRKELLQPQEITSTMTRVDFVNSRHEWEVQALDLYEEGLDQAQIVDKLFDKGDVVGPAAVADLIKRWQAVKRADTGADTQAELDRINKENEMEAVRKRAEEDERIRVLRAQGKSPTNIVYEIWDRSGSLFAERMARVKEVLASTATASTSEVTENIQNEPLPA